MKIVPHNTKTGVFVGQTTGVVLSTLATDAKPQSLTNDKGDTTLYHWAKVSIKDNDGHTQNGSAIIWDKLLQSNPADYTEGKSLDLDIQINGPGAGCAQVRLSNGRFEVSNHISAEELAQYSVAPTANATTQVAETA
jgi:hypothetical protein